MRRIAPRRINTYLKHVVIRVEDHHVCEECGEVGYAVVLALPSGLSISGICDNFSGALAAMTMKYAEVFPN